MKLPMMENESIKLRSRQLPSGNRSLYLEFYEKGGKRQYESLNLFLIPEKDEDDRRVNEATLKKALKLKSERVLGVERPKPKSEEPKVSRRAFCDWMDDYLSSLQSSDQYSVAYCNHVRSTINIVKAYLAHIKRPRMLMSKLDKEWVKGFLIYIKVEYRNMKSPNHPKPLSPKTMMLIQTNLNTMLGRAVKTGALARNPMDALETCDKFGKTPSEREFLTVAELNRLAKVETGSPTTKQTFMFCCFTGLRHSDMVALKWGDIKTTGAGLMLHLPSMQKTKQPVIVPLSEKALEWLPKRPADCKADTKVFANAPTLSCANRALKHMAKRADIRKTVTFHCSRHTFATMTLTAGGDLYTTSRLLGHTNIHSTEIYADVVMEKKADAVNRLNGIF